MIWDATLELIEIGLEMIFKDNNKVLCTCMYSTCQDGGGWHFFYLVGVNVCVYATRNMCCLACVVFHEITIYKCDIKLQ